MPDILGHASVLRLLQHALEHPVPGYLFHGPAGVGKRLVARWFSSKLLASDIEHLTSHPDMIVLAREEGDKNIKIEAVKEMVARMALTSAAGGRKVALIEGAESLREDATNALLKAVEEPSGHAVYLFVTEQPDRLPATLRSRLANVVFGSVPPIEIERWLIASGTEPALAREIALASRGAPGLAARIVADPEAWKKRAAQASALLHVLAHEPVGKQLGELERLAKTLNAYADPETAWKEFLAECFRVAYLAPAARPEALARVGRGLARARALAGSPLSPHLALEWAVVEPYHVGDAPSFLHPSYL